VFSGRAVGVAAHLASFSKIKPGSAAALLTLATELVLAALNDRGAVADGPAGLRKRLRSEEPEIRRTAPAGFDPDVGGARGGGGGGVGRWLPWALAAAGLLALLLLAERSRQEEPPVAPQETAARPATVATPEAAPPPTPRGTLEQITLPGGAVLELRAGTLNHDLARYLASDAPAGRTFTFETLEFRSGSSRLRPEAEATLETLARILAAYPDARVRLEGHTDEVGDAVNNERLSQARAAEAAEVLLGYGLAAERVTATGYGETRPLTTNATRTGRAVNRGPTSPSLQNELRRRSVTISS
jgi:outer membrane protein OmpA-like peptidoglycan-associated protein